MQEEPNPYAPAAADAPRRDAPLRGSGVVVRAGLAAWVLLLIASLAVGLRAIELRKLYYNTASEGLFHATMAVFHGVRLIGEVALVAAFVAGIVWLRTAWRLAPSRRRDKPHPSTAALVAWPIVPVIGIWKVYGFLADLARVLRMTPEEAAVGSVCFALAAYLVARAVAATARIPGVEHVLEAAVAATSAVVGTRMMGRFERALGDRAAKTRRR